MSNKREQMHKVEAEIPLYYTTLSQTVIKKHTKVDHHAGGTWFINGIKTPQGEPVAMCETLLLIILSLVSTSVHLI